MSLKQTLTDRIKGMIPAISLPTLGKSADVPVYLIHNSPDPEDYFFIFDFEQFVEASREGIFVRPKLKVWAGRDDFGRAAFARQFRESFSEEFDAARAALAQGSMGKGGWLSWGTARDVVGTLGANWVATVVLFIALSAGKIVWNALPVPQILRGKSDAGKLEDKIKDTQSKVDAALADMTIVLHRELWSHAYRGTDPGRMVGMEYDAWPLPHFVRKHLDDGTSTSWY